MALRHKKRTGARDCERQTYPYLPKNLSTQPTNPKPPNETNHTTAKPGFTYILKIIYLYSQFALSWKLFNSLKINFRLDALGKAIKYAEKLGFFDGLPTYSEQYNEARPYKALNYKKS